MVVLPFKQVKDSNIYKILKMCKRIYIYMYKERQFLIEYGREYKITIQFSCFLFFFNFYQRAKFDLYKNISLDGHLGHYELLGIYHLTWKIQWPFWSPVFISEQHGKCSNFLVFLRNYRSLSSIFLQMINVILCKLNLLIALERKRQTSFLKLKKKN